MLVLSRKPGESVVIDGRIKVKIVRLDGDVVKLGIEAPPDVPIHRQEVYDEIQQSNKQALQNNPGVAPKLNKPKGDISDRRNVETAGLAA
jgi:carbon storage regulator